MAEAFDTGIPRGLRQREIVTGDVALPAPAKSLIATLSTYAPPSSGG
jgi:hypothetical protein